MSNLNFGQAIEALKEGKKVARNGWNGKGMWLIFIKIGESNTGAGTVDLGNSGLWAVNSYFAIKTAQETLEAGWKPSTIDMLAEDWCIVE